jgi:hypothetical protein
MNGRTASSNVMRYENSHWLREVEAKTSLAILLQHTDGTF